MAYTAARKVTFSYLFVNHLSTEFSARPKLDYPFEKGWHPEPGVPHEVADGVYWLYVPMPIDLDHINLWLLRDGDGWVIVDCGFDAPVCKETWDKVFDEFLDASLVNKVVVTHFHPDHIGLASWLALRCDCKVWISAGEFGLYRNMLERDHDAFLEEVTEFITEIGFAAEYKEMYVTFFSNREKKEDSARVQIGMEVILADQDILSINGKDWQIVTGNGHSPEHACLYCSELGVLISGDQALPRISSNVSVYVSNRGTDPLRDWLTSCEKLKSKIPAGTLVLPAHQEPFVGIKLRMQQLIDDHHAQLNKLRILFQEPSDAVQACKALFARELSVPDTLFATGEALAHIDYLVFNGEIDKSISDGGAAVYQLSSNN